MIAFCSSRDRSVPVKTIIPESGQVSIPPEVSRAMQLTPGQTVVWEPVSATECRLFVCAEPKRKPDPVGALSFARRHGLETMRTEEWMKILREGEEE
jgi:hypothetical protein